MTKPQIVSADVKKHILASLPKTSFCHLISSPSSAKRGAREPQKSPNKVSLFGNVTQILLKFTSFEESLCQQALIA